MVTQGTGGQPLYDRLWGSGFLPSRYQGVKFRSVGDPVLYLSDPKGFGRESRRHFLDALNRLKPDQAGGVGRPRDLGPDLPVRNGLPHADLGARAHRPFGRAGSHLPALRRGRPGAGDLRRQLPAGPAAGRAGGPLYPGLPPWLGSARQAAHRASPAVQGHRPGFCRAGAGPEAAGNAGGHAGDLGRRVRTNRLLPGTADRKPTTAATITRGASPSG